MLSRDEIHAKMDELAALDGRQVLIQGGHHPYCKSDWWCDLLADVWRRVPVVWEGALPVAAPPPAGHACAAHVRQRRPPR